MYKRSIIIRLVCTQEDTYICKCTFTYVYSFEFDEIKVGNGESVPNTQMKDEHVYGCLSFTHACVTPSVPVDVILTGHILQHLNFVLN